jgi:hypothetical protein
MLVAVREQSAPEITQLLINGDFPSEQSLTNGLEVLPLVSGEQWSKLARMLMHTVLTNSGNADVHLKVRVCAAAWKSLKPDELIWTALSNENVSENIVLLDSADQNIRACLMANIDTLTNRLVQLRGPIPRGAAITTWAKLLDDSRHCDERRHLRASELALPYAFRLRHHQVSALIVASFPTVYAKLAEGDDSPSLLSLFLFTERDRCKVARRELVDAFVGSSWPPANLLVAATRSDIAQDVIRRVWLKYEGENYLTRIDRDIGRLPEELQFDLRRELEKFYANH